MSDIPLVQRPLILIGAGRSGSTLLTNILNNQPEISFHGETGFLAPRLWDEVWVDQFWYQWRDSVLKKQNQKARSAFQVAVNREGTPPNADENARRAGRLLADLFFELVGAQPLDHWGFKEPWLGHPSFDYDWASYDAMFPHALWLHLIRNPFDVARSAAHWNREALDETYLKRRLFEWDQMVKKGRERQITDRYFELRFEDLIDAPERALSDVFGRLGIDWNPANAEILKTKFIASSQQDVRPSEALAGGDVRAIAKQIEGFERQLESCGYTLPDQVQLSRPVLLADEDARRMAGRPLVARSPRSLLSERIQVLEDELEKSRIGGAIERRLRLIANRAPKVPGYALHLLWRSLGRHRWLLGEEPRELSNSQRTKRQALAGALSVPDIFYRRVFARLDRVLQTYTGALAGGRHRAGRVHFMIGSLQPGGAERQAAMTLAAVADRGCTDVGLSCMWLHGRQHRFFLPRLEREGISVDAIADHKTDALEPVLAEALAILPASLADVSQFAAAIADRKPGVVHLWLDEVNVKGGIAAIALGVPKIVLSTRNLPPQHFELHKAYMREAYRWLVRQPSVELINNSAAGARGYEAWLGLPRNSIQVIRNGVELNNKEGETSRSARGAFRAELGVADDAPLIGGVFRLQEEKRPQLFLEIAAEVRRRIPDAKFLIVGDGPLRAELEDRSRRPDLAGTVHFAGHEPDIRRVFRDLDLCLLASRAEGLPNVLIEAQAMGVPVVTTNAGGAAETMIHGRTGIVLEEATSDFAADTIAKLLRDDVWMTNARKAAQEFAVREFAVETVVEKTLALYGSEIEVVRSSARSSKN